MAQWEEYHTGTLNWSNGYVGVTESQFVQMTLFLVSALLGKQRRTGGERTGGAGVCNKNAIYVSYSWLPGTSRR